MSNPDKNENRLWLDCRRLLLPFWILTARFSADQLSQKNNVFTAHSTKSFLSTAPHLNDLIQETGNVARVINCSGHQCRCRAEKVSFCLSLCLGLSVSLCLSVCVCVCLSLAQWLSVHVSICLNLLVTNVYLLRTFVVVRVDQKPQEHTSAPSSLSTYVTDFNR